VFFFLEDSSLHNLIGGRDMLNKKAVERLWVFDLDGPLMDTGILYDNAIHILVKIVSIFFGGRISVDEIKKRQSEVDKRMIKEINLRTGRVFGLSKIRFTLSLMRTYKTFCVECGARSLSSIMSKLKIAGEDVCDKNEYEKIIRSEVLPLFKFLKNKGDKIFILTKGDIEVQMDKKETLCKLGIMDFCDGFIVVPDDKSRAIEKIKQENPALRCYCVGDTYEADVEPGIKVGYFGIHIPYIFNWMERGRATEVEAMRDKDRSVCVNNIAWIQERWRLLEKRAKAMCS
jgi:haloacid dehalogenase-like hydrolase